jgi:protein TonB
MIILPQSIILAGGDSIGPAPRPRNEMNHSKSKSSGPMAFHNSGSPGEVNILALFTVVVWLSCLLVGIVGLAMPYARPKGRSVPEKFIVQQLQVELTKESFPPLADTEPPPPDAMAPPEAAAVAQPGPAIAFAIPVEAPHRIVEPGRAEYARPVQTAKSSPAQPSVQTLIYGQGEGKQPAPEYPRLSRQQGQEGSVVVRFTVGENGRVIAVEALSRSPWPLLDEAALRGVRELWRFGAGPVRVYKVSIGFSLTK